MTLDATQPIDQALVSQLPSFIRANRTAINAMEAGAGFSVTDLTVPLAAVSLTVGVDIADVGLEVIIMSGAGAATLATILGGTSGQIKLIVFQDANVKISDGNDKADGKFYLNHLPAASDFEPQQDDIMCLVNIGGDGGATTHGYWKEVYRTLSLK